LSTYPIPTDTVDLLDQVIRTSANNSTTQVDLTLTRISLPAYSSIPNKLTQARPIQVVVQRQDSQTYPTTLTLAAGITATDTTIPLSATTGLSTSGHILLGTEYIYYGYVDGNSLGGCFRGQNGSTAASHLAAAAVTGAKLPSIILWPVPDAAQTYQLVYWRMRRIQDAGNGTNTIDVPFRFVPALVAGLAYYMAMKVPGGLERIQLLKQQYEESWTLAAGEDRERAAVMFSPKIYHL
jgi:hypothetical protein